MSEFFVKRKKILIVVFTVMVAAIVLPIVMAGGYTYLCEDDFSFEGGAKDLIRDYGNIYVGAWVRMVSYYHTNEGSFLFDYLMSAVRIYSRAGLPGFHIFMMLSIGLFFFTLGNLIRLIVKDWAATLGISVSVFVLLFGMNNTLATKEIIFWYTGVLYMLLVFILAFITTSLSICNIRTGKIRYAIWGMIIGFFASGGSLNVTSANCAWLLAILILTFPKVKERKSVALPFVGSFIGALINACAPGNFARLEGETSTVWEGLANTFRCYISDSKLLMSSRIFWGMLVFCFFICVVLKVKILPQGISNLQLIISIVGAWLVKFFSLFPITFANTQWHDMSQFSMRTFSSYEVVAKIMNIFIVIVIAQWLTERKEKIAEYGAGIAIVVMAAFLLITYPATKAELKNGMVYNVINDFRTGAMQETLVVREYVLSTLQMAEDGTDCIIYVPVYNKANSMYGMGLGVDYSWIVNQSAANLFDLHTATVIYSE